MPELPLLDSIGRMTYIMPQVFLALNSGGLDAYSLTAHHSERVGASLQKSLLERTATD